MKAISIRAPWWWCILHAGKRIENRHLGFPRYTGPILLHASSTWVKRDVLGTLENLHAEGQISRDVFGQLGPMREAGGHVVGTAVVVRAEPNGRYPDDYWAADEQLGLWLTAVRELTPHVKAKGQQGLFNLEGIAVR